MYMLNKIVVAQHHIIVLKALRFEISDLILT